MTRVGPHLTSKDAVKCCSVCGKQFPDDSKPSISKALVAHVREEHKRPEPPVKKLSTGKTAWQA